MNEVYIDQQKKRLMVRVSGFKEFKEALEICSKFISLLEELKKSSKEFTILLDLRGFKATTPEVQAQIVRVQDAYVSSGAKRIASVVDSVITTLQFQRLGKEKHIDSYLVRFNDLNAAIRWLDGEDLDLAEGKL